MDPLSYKIRDNLSQFATAKETLIDSAQEYIDNIFLEHRDEIVKLLTKNYSEGIILPKFYDWFTNKEFEKNKIYKLEYKYKEPVLHSWSAYRYQNIISFDFVSRLYEFYEIDVRIKIQCGYCAEYVFVEYDGTFDSSFHIHGDIYQKFEKNFCLNDLGKEKENIIFQ